MKGDFKIMTISLANALKSVKEDEHWIKKILIGGVVVLALAILSFIADKGFYQNAVLKLITIVLNIVLYVLFAGFIVVTANKSINSDSTKIAEWNEPNLLLTGLKYVGSTIVCGILLFLIFFVAGLVCGIALGIVGAIIYFLLSLICGGNCNFATQFTMIFSIVASTILGLYVMQFIFIIYASYYKNLKFRDIISFKKHFNILKENQHACWTLIGKNILYCLLLLFAIVACCVTLIGIVLVPFVYFIACLAGANLVVQFGRHVDIGKYLG